MKSILIQHSGVRLVTAMAAVSFSCFSVAQGAAEWEGAKVTKTDLGAGETKYGKFIYTPSMQS